MSGILLDINVLLDVFLARSPWLDQSAAVVQAGLDGWVTSHISAASLPTIFYLVRRKADLDRARAEVGECLRPFQVLPVDREAPERAASMTASDFEDNLLVACAERARLDAIVTRDPRGFTGSPIPAPSPVEFLARRPEGDRSASERGPGAE